MGCGIDFTSSQMARVDLSSARIENCTFTGCAMDGSRMTDASVTAGKFSKVSVSDADLSRARIQSCDFTGARLPAKAHWAGATVNGGNVPMKQLGFTCEEVRALGMVEGLK